MFIDLTIKLSAVRTLVIGTALCASALGTAHAQTILTVYTTLEKEQLEPCKQAFEKVFLS